MAAGNWQINDQSLLEFLNATQDFVNDDHYMVLVTEAHTPDPATEQTLSDISANECADPDYSPQNMTGESVTEAAGVVKFDADDVSFGNPVTISAKYAYIIKGTVAAKSGTDRIVAHSDLNTDSGSATLDSTNDSYSVPMNAGGIATFEQTS